MARATGNDVAQVLSRTATTLAGFGVLAGIANPWTLTAAGAAALGLLVYENYPIWPTLNGNDVDAALHASNGLFDDMLRESYGVRPYNLQEQHGGYENVKCKA